MPTVPRYNQPQVQEQAAPQVRYTSEVNAEAFGGGASAQKVNQAVFDIGEKAKKAADELATLDAIDKLTKAETRILYDQKSGALNKKGKDSLGAPDYVNTEIDKESEEIEKQLSNNTQREAFRKTLSARKLDIERVTGKHISSEMTKYENEVTQSVITTEADRALKNYNDPLIIESSIANQKAAYQSYAERNGMDAGVAAEKLRQLESGTHAQVVSRMLNDGDDLKAKMYFDKNKDLFSGEDQTKLAGALEEGSLRGESLRSSDDIFSKAGSLTTALAEARKIEDPKLRLATEEHLERRFAQKESAKREYLENSHRNAGNILDKNGGDWTKIPPNQWAQFSTSEKANLKAYGSAIASGKDIETDLDLWSDLITQASTPALKDKFLQTNLPSLKGQIARNDLMRLMDMQAKARKGEDDDELKGIRSSLQIVNGTMDAMKIKDKAERSSIMKSVDERVIEKQTELGRKLQPAEVQTIADELLTKVHTDKGLFGMGFMRGSKRLYEVDGSEEDIDIDEEDIPRSARKEIEAWLKSKKLAVTDKAVYALYSKKVKGK